eukprot:364781-Chlamydomonas_euryale.AAC.4
MGATQVHEVHNCALARACTAAAAAVNVLLFHMSVGNLWVKCTSRCLLTQVDRPLCRIPLESRGIMTRDS